MQKNMFLTLQTTNFPTILVRLVFLKASTLIALIYQLKKILRKVCISDWLAKKNLSHTVFSFRSDYHTFWMVKYICKGSSHSYRSINTFKGILGDTNHLLRLPRSIKDISIKAKSQRQHWYEGKNNIGTNGIHLRQRDEDHEQFVGIRGLRRSRDLSFYFNYYRITY